MGSGSRQLFDEGGDEMNSGARKDELRMSWNKKVSMREIAQFYEDKLRELDARQTKLMEDVGRKESELESKMQVLENSVEEIKDFVQNIEAMKKTMEQIVSNLRGSMTPDEMEKQVHALDILWKRTNEKVEKHEARLDDLHTDLVYAVMSIAINFSAFRFLQDFVYTMALHVDKDSLRGDVELSEDVELFNGVFLSDARHHIKNLLKNFRMFGSDIPNNLIDDLARTSIGIFLDRIKEEVKLADRLEKIQLEKGGTSND